MSNKNNHDDEAGLPLVTCFTVVFNEEVMAELVHVQRDAIGEAK